MKLLRSVLKCHVWHSQCSAEPLWTIPGGSRRIELASKDPRLKSQPWKQFVLRFGHRSSLTNVQQESCPSSQRPNFMKAVERLPCSTFQTCSGNDFGPVDSWNPMVHLDPAVPRWSRWGDKSAFLEACERTHACSFSWDELVRACTKMIEWIWDILLWCRREASFRVDFHDNHAVNLEIARSLHEACEKLALVLSRSVAVRMNSTAQPALNRPCWWLSCVAVFTFTTCRDQTICAQHKCRMPSVVESSPTHHQTTASSPTARRRTEALKALSLVVHLDHMAGWCLEKTAWGWKGTKLLVCHLHRSSCTKFARSTAK